MVDPKFNSGKCIDSFSGLLSLFTSGRIYKRLCVFIILKKKRISNYYNFTSEVKNVLCGLVVKISGFHLGGRGSNPGTGVILRNDVSVCCLVQHTLVIWLSD